MNRPSRPRIAAAVRPLARRAGGVVAALAVLLAGLGPASAQTRVGTTAAPFLTIGTGARTSALGYAGTAYATGPDALFWNPGGATSATSGGEAGVLFSHYEWFAGITYDAVGFTLPIVGPGVLGAHLVYLDYGRMEVTNENVPGGLTGETFGASDLAVGLTYTQPLTDAFTFGGTVKFVRQGIRDMSASTVAVDLGFVLQTDYLGGARLAAAIRNFGGQLRMDGINARVFVDPDEESTGNNDQIPARYELSSWNLPLSFTLGVAVPAVRVANTELLLLADVQQINDFDLNGDLGAELNYRIGPAKLALRGGYKDLTGTYDAVAAHLTYGGGVEVDVSGLRFGVDFAYLPFEYLGGTQLFDVRFYF